MNEPGDFEHAGLRVSVMCGLPSADQPMARKDEDLPPTGALAYVILASGLPILTSESKAESWVGASIIETISFVFARAAFVCPSLLPGAFYPNTPS
jgi:hypothetical protein